MKKITTNGRSFGTAQSLTWQQLKNVMGGLLPTTKARHYRCCTGTSCSDCISVPAGSHAECEEGVITSC